MSPMKIILRGNETTETAATFIEGLGQTDEALFFVKKSIKEFSP